MRAKIKLKRALALLLSLTLAFSALGILAYADTASDFVSAVNAIKNAPSLSEKSSNLAIADDLWNSYTSGGGSASDSSVAHAYLEYVSLKSEIEEAVESCELFIEAVGEANAAWSEGDYFTARDALDRASAELGNLDTTYGGVGSSKTLYESVLKDVQDFEKPYQLFISLVLAADEADGYKTKKKNINDAAGFLREIQLNPFHTQLFPGFGQALEKKAEVEQELAAILEEASVFILAVQGISGETEKEDILTAYVLYEGIDSTADGVSAAKDTLDARKKNYDDIADASDKAIEDMHKFIFGNLMP